ncbi:MAG: formylglycine-generating enzyme family protein [Chromatiaceae bacterium]|nr:formylglycine-generating enzyme family protein [Chromatiaceae bacterium]
MIQAQALGALAGAHELLLQLLEGLPARDCNRRFDAELPSAGWLLGRAVYLELHLLRGLVMGDDDLAQRVRHLFADEQPPGGDSDALLPPQDHLLNWADEVFDKHLTWLANPGFLPEHALLDESWLVWHLAERLGLLYERLLAVLNARSARRASADYQVQQVLEARLPVDDSIRIEQGHYRIGARDGVVMPNEQPPQIVELHAYRISRRPVSNAEYLAFIEDGGYRDSDCWDEGGRQWRAAAGVEGPWHWRRDNAGHWYAIGMNGAMDLHPGDLVNGLCAHEARAFAAWAAAHGQGLSGAVPPHEYQWEVAARLGEIELYGRVWEWCANTFHSYPSYQAPMDPVLEPCRPDDRAVALRGGCLHTQPSLRRSTFRLCAPAERRALFAGLRLVMPPGRAAWE